MKFIRLYSALSNASAMRVCHPGPVAFHRAKVDAGKRSVVDTFTGAFCGPRRRTVPMTLPAFFITAPFQSAVVVRGLSTSWTMSLSLQCPYPLTRPGIE